MSDWNPRANEIFLAALELPSREDRSALIDERCGCDEVLRGQVDSLLEASAKAGSFLEHPLLQGTEAELQDEGDLDFLNPSESPECLGRLGEYEITHLIGRGGMGIVLRGQDSQLNRVVAIKVLAPELAGNTAARRRFLREGRAAAAVTHQQVVTIHAVGEDKLPYLVMEYVEGQSLQERIDREGTLRLEEILRIGSQVATGLAAAHAQGLIHRDIKPANILLENGVERVRITDFGLARAVDDARITREGEVTGTPQYMSPEQARGETVDARSDLFSLGCVLYATCTGRSPFRADTTVAAIRRVCEEAPRSVPEINPEVPGWLATVIDRLLKKNPDDRFQSATETAELLEHCLAHVQNPDSMPLPSFPWARTNNFKRTYSRIAAGAMLVVVTSFVLCEATGTTNFLSFGSVESAGTVSQKLPDKPTSRRSNNLEPSRTQSGLPSEGPAGEICRFEGHTHETSCLTFSPDGRRAIVGDGWRIRDGALAGGHFDFGIRVFDLANTQQECYLLGETRPFRAIALIRKGRVALTASNTVRSWNLEKQKMLPALAPDYPSGIRQAAFSKDGEYVAIAGYDRKIRLWNLNEGTLMKTFEGHTDGISTVALSPDGEWIVAACGGDHVEGQYVWPQGKTLRVWKIETGRELHTFGDFSEAVTDVAVSPDSQHVLTGGSVIDDPGVRLWVLQSGELVKTFTGHTDTVSSVEFSPDGRHILTGSDDKPSQGDGSLRLWDIDTGVELHRFPGHERGIRTAVFSPDGRYALSGGILDGTVILWRLPRFKAEIRTD